MRFQQFVLLLIVVTWPLEYSVAEQAASSELRQQVASQVNSAYPTLEPLYKDLHAHPELSWQEQSTSQRLAQELEQRGLAVTRGVGRNGVVAVLKNGAGPTVLVRT